MKKYLLFLIVIFMITPQLLKGQSEIFIENKGQFPEKVKAYASLNIGNVWLCNDGLWLHFWNTDDVMKIHDRSLENTQIASHSVQLDFVNANYTNIDFEGSKSDYYVNYFKGNNPKKWATELYKYSKIIVRSIYKDVDLEIIASNGGIKYNWICSQEKLSLIKIKVNGAGITKNSETELRFETSILNWNENIPLVYESANPSSIIPCQYILNGNEIAYKIQRQTTLKRNTKIVVDPVLVFSTYSGSSADNFGCTGTYDEIGNGYSGGTVFDVGLPVTTGAFQIQFGGGVPEELGYGGDRDIALLKYNQSGSKLVFCTYLGGSDNEQPHSMVVDSLNNLYVMATTKSSDFPVTVGSYDVTWNGSYDFTITKISWAGTKILAGTYVGGSGQDGVGADRSVTPVDDFPLLYNYADEFRGEIITDNKTIFVCGVTYSDDFPQTVGSRIRTVEEDGTVFSLTSDLKSLNWSQVIGDEDKYYDAIYGIALGKNSDLYAAGGTNSRGLKSQFSGVWQNDFIGDVDGMLMRFDSKNGIMLSGKYYGTANYEQAYFVQTDLKGNPYIYGQTEGQINTINSPYSQSNTGQFITKHSQDLNTILIQTTFGANGNMPNISPSAFLVDRCERIFISGWGGATNTALYDINTGASKVHRNKGNTRNLQTTNDAIQKTTDGSDFYIAVFSKNMYNLAFGTFFGGVSTGSKKAEEHVDGGTSRFDKKGIIYQSVCAGCRQNGLFPVTPTAFSTTMNSRNCNNALFKIDFENLNKKPWMSDTFIKVTATELIDIQKFAYDADVFDTVNLRVKWLKKGAMKFTDTASVTTTMGINRARLKLKWQTTCGSFSKDTVKLQVMIYDCGCPKSDTTYATISILIEEPPKVIPPDAICVSYDRVTKQMKISWPATTVPTNFFKYFLIERTNPDGTKQIVDTVFDNLAGQFIDNNVVNPQLNNYCFGMIGVNICDTKVQPINVFCTVRELNNSIDPVHLISASVFEDRRVDVKWVMSAEPKFKEFEIYKYPITGSMGSVPEFVIKDTTLSDSSFNVDKQAFCYQVIVVDKCGHISKPSNKGCNVVISGTSVEAPDYYFNLKWADYVGWDSGVSIWDLQRKNDIEKFKSMVIQSNRLFKDDKLDYDWGGYWYRAIGYEAPTKGIYYKGITESNWVYLYQPPEVWVPNAFTVNNDKLNEVWGTVPIFVKGYSMKVYDRWGQKIWESFDKKRQWDGTINGIQVQDGVYAWLLSFDGWNDKRYQKTGTVMVLH